MKTSCITKQNPISLSSLYLVGAEFLLDNNLSTVVFFLDWSRHVARSCKGSQLKYKTIRGPQSLWEPQTKWGPMENKVGAQYNSYHDILAIQVSLTFFWCLSQVFTGDASFDDFYSGPNLSVSKWTKCRQFVMSVNTKRGTLKYKWGPAKEPERRKKTLEGPFRCQCIFRLLQFYIFFLATCCFAPSPFVIFVAFSNSPTVILLSCSWST